MTGKPGDAERFGEVLAEHLRKVAQAQSRDDRKRAFDAMAEAVTRANVANPVLSRFLAGDNNAQRVALEILSRVTPPDASTAEKAIPLVQNRRYPVQLRLRAAARLLRILPPFQQLSNQVLQAAIARASKRKAYERLQLLQAQLPGYAPLDQLCKELADDLAMDCPKCKIRLERNEMVTHLWREHRLILERDQVRDPWKRIDEWLKEYARTGRTELLDRCCDIGQQLDPAGGLLRVQRQLLSIGMSDEEAKANLQSKAVEQQGTICPSCFAVVSDLEDRPPELSVSRGRLSGGGYEVQVEDRRLTNHLTITTPSEVVYDGPEPGRRWTLRGSVLLKVGPLVLAALAIALAMPVRSVPPLMPVAIVLLAALLLYMRMRLKMDATEDPTERVLMHAWDYLAPQLCRPVFSPDDASFLSALARLPPPSAPADVAEREPILERIGKLTQEAIANRAAPPELFPSIKRLELQDAALLNRDRLVVLANSATPCFAGRLPVRVLEELLSTWSVKELSQGDRARLRVLLLTRAFEAGLEPLELHDLGRAFPFLGQAYASEDIPGMTRLRWLFLVKPQRPWRKIGSATPVLDLARYPALGGQYLQMRPDLLLFQPMGDVGSDDPASAPILVCEEGVLYREILIDDPDTKIEVFPRSVFQGGGFEMNIGTFKLTFRKDPAVLRRRLVGWVRYLFRELLPQAERVRPRRSGLIDGLLRQKRLTCPDCKQMFLSMHGEVGIPWEESDEPLSESAAS